MATAKKTDETSLTPAVDKALAAAGVPEGSWGAPQATTSDLVIPRIMIMQGLSKLMQDDTLGAKLGEVRESLEGRLLGSKDKPLQFIPFFITTTWINREKINGKFEFKSQEPRTGANDDLPWDWTEKNEHGKDVEFKREKAINAYVLIPSEIDTGEFLPYVLSFSKTAFKAGKKFMTLVEMLKQGGLAPAHRVFELSVQKTENEKGTWYNPEVKKLGATAPKHLAAAYKWYQTVSAGAVRVDEPVAEEATDEATGTREY